MTGAKEHNLTFVEKAIIAAFDRWIKEHPKGGIFSFNGVVLTITKK